MLDLQHITTNSTHEDRFRAVQASLVDPSPSILADYLKLRLASERNELNEASLPAGINQDNRPTLPKVGMAALMLFNNQDKKVDSYPLIYNSLALAHPN